VVVRLLRLHLRQRHGPGAIAKDNAESTSEQTLITRLSLSSASMIEFGVSGQARQSLKTTALLPLQVRQRNPRSVTIPTSRVVLKVQRRLFGFGLRLKLVMKVRGSEEARSRLFHLMHNVVFGSEPATFRCPNGLTWFAYLRPCALDQ
jgi:hypothetical protein